MHSNMANEMQDDEVKFEFLKVRVLSFLSSFLFLIGALSVFLTAFGGDNSALNALSISDLGTKLISFGYFCWILHAIAEISIDKSPVRRPFAHMRYGKTRGVSRSVRVDLVRMNVYHSIIFSAASFFQGLAFAVLLELSKSNRVDGVNIYVNINLLASLLWLVSAAMTVSSRGCCWLYCFRTNAELFDQTANGLFVSSSIVWMFAALNVYSNVNQALLGDYLQDVVIAIWLAVGCLYVIADLMRIPTFIASVNTTPLGADGTEDDNSDVISWVTPVPRHSARMTEDLDSQQRDGRVMRS